MFTIGLDNRIEVIRGDTGILELTLDNYKLKEGDKVYFTVKSSYEGERLIFKEVTEFTDGKAKFILTSQDTDLKIGMYLYDVQCNLADGRVDTVISPAKFKVLGGVTDV
ncbi:hypothetical protein ACQPUY_17700 [Clostridium nigeriense]|uniref:hypothetical protein n=1 Tax=Clostridium nigeriense TaxID=1805470 RepID=UPI003D33828C